MNRQRFALIELSEPKQLKRGMISSVNFEFRCLNFTDALRAPLNKLVAPKYFLTIYESEKSHKSKVTRPLEVLVQL